MLEVMNHGGKVALLGIPPPNMPIDWNQVIFKGLEIKGIYGREMFETWYKMVAMLQSGLDLSPVITHRFPVDDYQAGFAAMLSGNSRQGDPRLGGVNRGGNGVRSNFPDGKLDLTPFPARLRTAWAACLANVALR